MKYSLIFSLYYPLLMFFNHSKNLVLIGFIAVMVLMIAVVSVGYKEMNDINRRMELIVNKYNAKTSYITTMYTAARERSISLLRMLDMEDPFDRDEEYLHFNKLATDFAIARIAMSELGFDEQETAYSDEQYELTRTAMPLLDQVVTLLFQDKPDEARAILLNQAIPAQDMVLVQLSSMLDYQDQAAKRSLQAANDSFKEAKLQILVLCIGAILIGILIAWFVISHASRARDALFAQVTLASIGDAVITTDEAGKINYLNPLAEKMTGWSFEKAAGKPVIEVFYVSEEKGVQDYNDIVRDAIDSEQPLTIINQANLKNANNESIAIDFTITPILDEKDKRIGTALSFRNMNKERELREQLSYQACHDALTGLINRYEFERRLDNLIQSSIKNDSTHGLFYLDLDEFKVVNDTCGHIAGDELLRQLSFLLKNKLRSHDTIARLGGDEFGIIVEDCKPEKAVSLATKILHAIQNFHFAWEEKTFKVGASIGVVEINKHSKDIANVMSIADASCYSAKDGGRNRVHVAEQDDMQIASRRGEMQWVSKINDALNNHNFCLHYQKIEPLLADDQQTAGIELLLRMQNDDGELISPGAFIPAAERYNLMAQLDRWVISSAFDWLSAHPDLNNSLFKCAINLSGQSFSDESFLDEVKNELTRLEINPSLICFEITETAAISNLAKATEFIDELKAMGCCFALDDFGSGLSSFAYLKNLSVDFIKIDGMFVKDIVHDEIDKEMVSSITSIAKAMGKETIAEFVENEEIKQILQEMGVDYVQGYHIEKPRPLEEFPHQKMGSAGNLSQQGL